MFKTVKMGDTSIQYTIVSQTDDSTCASSSVTPSLRKSKIKRRSRHRMTVILILITLVMGCGIVIAAVLVPILVASELVSNFPESAKFKTFAIAASSIQGYSKYDQNGHKYVELLPIKRPPVDAVIEFQDEIPMSHHRYEVWPTNDRLNVKPKALNKPEESAIDKPQQDDSKKLVLNSSQVTFYVNKTENFTSTKPQFNNVFSNQEETSNTSPIESFVDIISTEMMRRHFIFISTVAAVVVFLLLVALFNCRKQRMSRTQKMEPLEDKSQRNLLLTSIPVEDD